MSGEGSPREGWAGGATLKQEPSVDKDMLREHDYPDTDSHSDGGKHGNGDRYHGDDRYGDDDGSDGSGSSDEDDDPQSRGHDHGDDMDDSGSRLSPMLANHPPDSSGEKPSKPQYSRPFVPPDNLPAHLLKRGVKRSDPDEERRYMQDETKLRKTLAHTPNRVLNKHMLANEVASPMKASADSGSHDVSSPPIKSDFTQILRVMQKRLNTEIDETLRNYQRILTQAVSRCMDKSGNMDEALADAFREETRKMLLNAFEDAPSPYHTSPQPDEGVHEDIDMDRTEGSVDAAQPPRPSSTDPADRPPARTRRTHQLVAKSIEEVEEEARQQARWEKERTRQERESQKNDDGVDNLHSNAPASPLDQAGSPASQAPFEEKATPRLILRLTRPVEPEASENEASSETTSRPSTGLGSESDLSAVLPDSGSQPLIVVEASEPMKEEERPAIVVEESRVMEDNEMSSAAQSDAKESTVEEEMKADPSVENGEHQEDDAAPLDTVDSPPMRAQEAWASGSASNEGEETAESALLDSSGDGDEYD